MFGKILGKVVSLPIRATGLAARGVEELVQALDVTDEPKNHEVSRTITRGARKVERTFEEVMDE